MLQSVGSKSKEEAGENSAWKKKSRRKSPRK
jgi:hypothetical protein